MSRLKNLLQYDASKFIHVGIIALLYVLTKTSYLAYLLLIPELVILLKHSKNIIIYSLIIVLIITVRLHQKDFALEEVDFPYHGIVTEVFDNHFYLKGDQMVLCYYENTVDIIPGMVVDVIGSVSNPSTFQIMHTFDYEQYLKSQGIQTVIYVNNLDVVNRLFHIKLIPYQIGRYIDQAFEEKTASYLKLFVLGNSNDFDEDYKEKLSSLGISHLFAVSGMHLGFIVGLLSYFLKKLYWTKETNNIIIGVFLIGYNMITGFKLSIIRASLLIIGLFMKDMFRIILSKTDLLTFSFLMFLIINPYIVYNLGFQLSYLIAVSILLCDYLFQKDQPIKRMLQVTLLATLVSLPITLKISHTIGLIFMFANLFFILYISTIFLPLSFLVLFLPFLQDIYSFVITIFEQGITIFSKLNIIVDFNFSLPIYALLYWGLLAILLINIQNKKRIILIVSGLFMVVLSSLFLNYKSTVFVRFLDVSQGDAIHVHDHGCDMLIDTGKPDNYDNIISYLEGSNTRQIDVLVITHFHSDHVGELENIVSTLNVNTIYTNHSTELVDKEIVVQEGDCFTCGSSKFQVLNADNGSSNENNNSIVLYGVIGGVRYLFTGDIEQEVESKIVDNYEFNIDVLKVAHHGSSTSTIDPFLQKVSGNLAIISVGRQNTYGLPDQQILNRLLDYNYNVYRTDLLGTITIYHYNFCDYYLIETYQKSKHPRYILWDI